MTFSEKLTALRKQSGLSQEALAEQLGVSRQAVSKWERQEAQPELSKILALCELFEVTPNELLGYEVKKELTTIKNSGEGIFWLVVGCMGFLILLLTDSDGIGWLTTLFGMSGAYFVLSGKGNFLSWLIKEAKWYLNQLFKDGNAL